MDYTEKSPVILSICPGMCGLERGFERACERIGWRRPITAAYVEIEAFIAYNLVKQMEQGVLDAAPVHTNVKTFNGSILRNRIDAIFGGYPCQPFSVAGLIKGADDPRHLWPFIGKGENSIIGTTRPIFCFFENVPGHITEGFDEVYRDLSDLGYAVEPGIFSAEEVGAPHKRKRLFILAIRKDCLEHPESWRTGGLRDENSERQGLGAAGTGGIHIRERGNTTTSESGTGKPSGTELANTGLQRPPGTEQQATRTEQRSEINLADTNSDGNENRHIAGGIDETTGGVERENGERERSGTEFTSGGEFRELSNPNGLGLRTESDGIRETGITSKTRSQWPAKPGQPQYDWEAPRVESGLGFVVNGYNFREDLLRMAGNGVVEQTAELAFLILLQKQLKNIENI